MILTITDLYRQTTEQLEGTAEDIADQLSLLYPEVASDADEGDGLVALVEHLNSSYQGLEFVIEPIDSLKKGWPKDEADNQANMENDAVLRDAYAGALPGAKMVESNHGHAFRGGGGKQGMQSTLPLKTHKLAGTVSGPSGKIVPGAQPIPAQVRPANTSSRTGTRSTSQQIIGEPTLVPGKETQIGYERASRVYAAGGSLSRSPGSSYEGMPTGGWDALEPKWRPGYVPDDAQANNAYLDKIRGAEAQDRRFWYRTGGAAMDAAHPIPGVAGATFNWIPGAVGEGHQIQVTAPGEHLRRVAPTVNVNPDGTVLWGTPEAAEPNVRHLQGTIFSHLQNWLKANPHVMGNNPLSLKKAQSAPKSIPGIGVGPVSKEVDLVAKPRALYMKRLLHRKREDPQNFRMPKDLKDKAEVMDEPKVGAFQSYGKRHGPVDPKLKSRNGYARMGLGKRLDTPDLAFRRVPSGDERGTMNHEQFHVLMGAVTEKHGAQARSNLARNLWHALPSHLQTPLAQLHDWSVGGVHNVDDPHFYEERIARAYNYMNAPDWRSRFHSDQGHSEHDAHRFGNHVKHSARALRAILGVVDNNWLGAQAPWDSRPEARPTVPNQTPIRKADTENELLVAMHGHRPHLHHAFVAAQWLAGGAHVDQSQRRAALFEHDGDVDRAALAAHGLEVNDKNLAALKAVKKQKNLFKIEAQVDLRKFSAEKGPKQVFPGVQEAAETAKDVEAAYQEGDVKEVELGGVHSAGSLLAKGKDHNWLLKPGAGGISPARGAAEEPASQSRREAAFWHIAESWGLGDDIPRCDLVLIDGAEYAAIRMLDKNWENLGPLMEDDRNRGLGALQKYRANGMLHQWAVLDFVLGNTDRHSSNLMIDKDDRVKLIDHGSAFAGPSFDPGHDQDSFVPFYLRAWVKPGEFKEMPTPKKLTFMPGVSAEIEFMLRRWVRGLDEGWLTQLLTEYGISPGPTLQRLARVKALREIAVGMNSLWVTT